MNVVMVRVYLLVAIRHALHMLRPTRVDASCSASTQTDIEAQTP